MANLAEHRGEDHLPVLGTGGDSKQITSVRAEQPVVQTGPAICAILEQGWGRTGENLAESFLKVGKSDNHHPPQSPLSHGSREAGNLGLALSTGLAFPPTALQQGVSRKNSLPLKRRLDTLNKTTERKRTKGTMINKRQIKNPP